MLANRSDRQLVISTLAATGGLLAIGLIAANLNYLDLGQGAQNSKPIIDEIARVVTAVLVAIWIVIAAIVIWRMMTRKRGLARKGPAPQGGVLGLLIVLAILGIIILFLRVNNLNFFPQEQGGGAGNGEGGNGEPAGPSAGLVGGEFLFIVFMVVIIVGVLMLLRFGRRTPIRLSVAERKAQEETLGVVQQAIEDLKESDDPREVIISTYRQMSRLMSSRKLAEQETLTASEFARLAIGRFGWAAAPIQELTHLFEEARYSQHSMGLGHKQRAMACLEDIRRALNTPSNMRGGASAAVAD